MDNIQGILADCLREFFTSFRASLDPRVWYNLIKEEHEELKEALEEGGRENILKEMSDLMYVQIGFNLTVAGAEQFALIHPDEQEEMMDYLNECGETYNKAIDTLGESTQFFEAFRRVHNSNLSKLGEDGKPVLREDGKVLKGPNYKEPNLKDLV